MKTAHGRPNKDVDTTTTEKLGIYAVSVVEDRVGAFVIRAR